MNDILEYIKEDLSESNEDFRGLDELSGEYICHIWRNAPERLDREPLESPLLDCAGLKNESRNFSRNFLLSWASVRVDASLDFNSCWGYDVERILDRDQYQKELNEKSYICIPEEEIPEEFSEKEVEECYIFRAYFGDDDFWSFEDRETAESPDVHKFSIVVFADGSALYRDGWSGDVWTCNRDDFIGQDIFWYDSIFYNIKTGKEVKMDF